MHIDLKGSRRGRRRKALYLVHYPHDRRGSWDGLEAARPGLSSGEITPSTQQLGRGSNPWPPLLPRPNPTTTTQSLWGLWEKLVLFSLTFNHAGETMRKGLGEMGKWWGYFPSSLTWWGDHAGTRRHHESRRKRDNSWPAPCAAHGAAGCVSRRQKQGVCSFLFLILSQKRVFSDTGQSEVATIFQFLWREVCFLSKLSENL